MCPAPSFASLFLSVFANGQWQILDISNIPTSTPSMANAHQQRFLASVADLLGNETYSDLTIECEGHRFFVNKSIVCPQSPVLERQCRSRMREGLDSVIKHDTFDRDTVGRMLSYMYRQAYEIESQQPADVRTNAENDERKDEESTVSTAEDDDRSASEAQAETSPKTDDSAILIAHADVYGIADYYDIPMLRDLAVDKFRTAIEKGIHAETFLHVVKAVQERDCSASGALRNALGECATVHRSQWATNEVCMHQLANLDGVQDFAVDIVGRLTVLEVETKETSDATLAAVRAEKDDLQRVFDGTVAHLDLVENDLITRLISIPACCSKKLGGRVQLKLEHSNHGKIGDRGGFYKISCGHCGNIIA